MWEQDGKCSVYQDRNSRLPCSRDCEYQQEDHSDDQELSDENHDDSDLYADFDYGDDSDEEVSENENLNISSIAKNLGFDADNIDDLKDKINSKIEEYKSSADEWKNGVPQELIKAVELSKSGGDYLDYLNA